MNKVLEVIDLITTDPTVKSIINSVNSNQEKSKDWLIEKSTSYLELILNPKIVVLAGWYGNLANRLSKFSTDKVVSIDIDNQCQFIGKKLYDGIKFKTENIIDSVLNDYNVVVCTSCEHINQSDFDKVYGNIKKGSLVILQSNNYFDFKDHIRCFNDSTEFKNSVYFQKLLYEGELKLKIYNRFMLIGIK